jgi:hypothetical protein
MKGKEKKTKKGGDNSTENSALIAFRNRPSSVQKYLVAVPQNQKKK